MRRNKFLLHMHFNYSFFTTRLYQSAYRQADLGVIPMIRLPVKAAVVFDGIANQNACQRRFSSTAFYFLHFKLQGHGEHIRTYTRATLGNLKKYIYLFVIYKFIGEKRLLHMQSVVFAKCIATILGKVNFLNIPLFA